MLPLLAATALAATLSIDDYATMPGLSSPRFSPDGKRIVYVVSRADLTRSSWNSDLRLVDADGHDDLQLTAAPGSDDHPRWSPDGKTIAFLSDRDGRPAVWLIDARGGEARKLGSTPGPVHDLAWSPDGTSMAVLMTDPVSAEDERRIRERDDAHVVGASRRQTHLYLIDLGTGKMRRLTHGDFSVKSVSWSPDGKTIAVERLPGMGLDDLYRTDLYTVDATVACEDNSCPKMTPLVVRPGVDRAPHFSPDGKSVAFLSEGGVFSWVREHQLWVIDMATRQAHVVAEDYGRTPEGLSWLDATTIVFDGPVDSTSQLFRAKGSGAPSRAISAIDGVLSDSDVDRTRGRAVFVEQSMTAPPELYVSDLTTFAPRQLTHVNGALRNRAHAPTSVIHWKNPKDGLEIEGLLTLPAGYKAGDRVPLLTFVHGGPASRFDQSFLGYLGFLYAPEVLASKGFAVLRPNPRGTGGYGESFRQANRGDWGGMDWIDINAGIDKLIADGIADPSRLGLMGWSYGGFMSAWAVGHSDRFRAISIGAPVVDLLSFHGTTDIRDFIPGYFPSASSDSETTGGTSTDPASLESIRHAPLSLDVLRAHSPLWHLVPTKAHILVQQGEADERVPISQGTMLYRMLDELGADVSMVTYPRSAHVPREPKQRIDVMRRNVEFFEKWVK